MTTVEQCKRSLGDAVVRRRNARKELAAARSQAQRIGGWLQVVVNHLCQPRPCQVANENGTLVFRTAGDSHRLLYKEEEGAPSPTPHPSAERLAELLNQITSLETEIAELTTILDA